MHDIAPKPRPKSMLRVLLGDEAAGGLVLMAVAGLALITANSPLGRVYFEVLEAKLFGLTILHWINDALMSLFFLLVGLEIKREMLDGQLRTWSRRALPGIAAAGGMVAPAIVYGAFNLGDASGMRGWAIPAATDIAFALGVLALLGRRVPASLKVFLTALAILDDLGAVLIIALFYTADLSGPMLALAALGLVALAGLNRAGVVRLWPYLLIGLAVWAFVLRSGVHATVAGVAVALTVPLRATPGAPESVHSTLHRLEHGLQPWVAFGIVPIFGFANAGVSFSGLDASAMFGPVPLGIALGLFVGKQAGVFAAAWAAIRAGWADLPAHATWTQLYGVALLCGIGFTMSLFIGALAFPASPDLADAAKIGVLAGSIASALAGWTLLRFVGHGSAPDGPPQGTGQP